MRHMEKFIAICQRGNEDLDGAACWWQRPPRDVPPELAADWIARAQAIVEELQVLPGAQEPPVVPQLQDGAQDNGITELPPGQCFPIDVEGLGPGNALVLMGDIIDDDGNMVDKKTKV